MKKIKSKLITLLTSAVMLSTVLAGCGSSPSATPAKDSTTKDTKAGDTQAKDKQVTLSLLVSETEDTPGLRNVIAEIEKKLNIKTEVELRPGGPEGDNIVKTRLATGDMSDLSVYNSGSLLFALNPDQYFVDLTKEPFMANVMDSFKKVVTDKGKVFGIPVMSSRTGAWLYNKKVYKELGLSVPKTWDELMANSEKIKAAGKTAVIGSFKTNWTAQLILLADYFNVQAQDPTFADQYNAGKAKFATSPAALKGFEKLEEVYKKGFMNKDFNSTTYDQAQKMLVDGTGVQYPMLTSVLPMIAKNYPDQVDNIGIFPQPSDSADKNGYTVWMPNTVLLNKQSKNIDAAKKWMEYYISPEGMAAYAAKSKPIGPFVVKGAKLPDDTYEAVKEMMPFFDSGKIGPALEFVSPVKGPNLPQICTEVGGGMTSALEGAKAYDKDVEKQAKQLGLPGW